MLKSIALAACAAFAVAGGAAAQTCATYPNTLTNGTTADASQVMANFNCAALTGRALFTGNVGFGTTTPGSAIDVFGAVHILGTSSPNLTQQGLNLSWNLLTHGTGESDFINNLGLGVGGFAFMQTPLSGTPVTTLMFLDGGGHLGIGTTTPADTLDVTNEVVFGPTTGGRISISDDAIGINRQVTAGMNYQSTAYAYQWQHASSTSPGSDYLALQIYDPTGGMFSGAAIAVNGGGAVSIGGGPQPGWLFTSQGTAGGVTGWVTTSDARLKQDVTPITDALTLVEQLQGVRYHWRAVADRPVGKALALAPTDQPQIGFLAQDVAKVVPEAVVTPGPGPDAAYGMMESKLIPILVEAVKAQQAEIAALEAEWSDPLE